MSGKYQIIYADPPWRYENRAPEGRELKYPTMALADICALPVREIAASDCALFMWCTWPHYESAIPVMNAWGFDYKTVAFVWIKTVKDAPIHQGCFFPADRFDDRMGLGHWTRGNTEFCLLGVRGRPQRQSGEVRQIIYSPLGGQSAKPPETRGRIEQLMGALPRVELFARDKVDGWDAWGNEVESDVEIVA